MDLWRPRHAAGVAIPMVALMVGAMAASDLCTSPEDGSSSLVQAQPLAAAAGNQAGDESSIIDMTHLQATMSNELQRFSSQAESMSMSVSESEAAHRKELNEMNSRFEHELNAQKKNISALQAKNNQTSLLTSKKLGENQQVLAHTTKVVQQNEVMRDWFQRMVLKMNDSLMVLRHAGAHVEDFSAPDLAVLRAQDEAKPISAEEIMNLGSGRRYTVSLSEVASVSRHRFSVPPSLSLRQEGQQSQRSDPMQAEASDVPAEQLKQELVNGLHKLDMAQQEAKTILRTHFAQEFEAQSTNYSELVNVSLELNEGLTKADAEGTKLRDAESRAENDFNSLKGGLRKMVSFAKQVDADMGREDDTAAETHPGAKAEAEANIGSKGKVAALQVSSSARHMHSAANEDAGGSTNTLPSVDDVMSKAAIDATSLKKTLATWEDRAKQERERGAAALAAADDQFATQLAAQDEKIELVSKSNEQLRKDIAQTDEATNGVRSDIQQLKNRLHKASGVITKVENRFNAAFGFMVSLINRTSAGDRKVLTFISQVPGVQVEWRSLQNVRASPLAFDGGSLSLLQESFQADPSAVAGNADVADAEQEQAMRIAEAVPLDAASSADTLDAEAADHKPELEVPHPAFSAAEARVAPQRTGAPIATRIEQLGTGLATFAEEQAKVMAEAQARFEAAKAKGERKQQALLEEQASLKKSLEDKHDQLSKFEGAKAFLNKRLINATLTIKDVRAFVLDTKHVLESTLDKMDGRHPEERSTFSAMLKEDEQAEQQKGTSWLDWFTR